MLCEAPIGVFDSGVGGLSIVSELRRVLPYEDFLYLADTAHVPYGTRADNDIRDLTERAVSALHERGVKVIVIACNTASAFSLTYLRRQYSFPIIGLVPAVKPAVSATRSGVIGILATPGTLRGTLLHDVVQKFAVPVGVRVLTAVSTELVPLVETGNLHGKQVRAILHDVLTPLARADADQLVLGCTHYPFLRKSILEEFGNTFTLVDSGLAVARHTRNILHAAGLLRQKTAQGKVTYLSTGQVNATAHIISTLLNMDPKNIDVHQVTT